MTEETVRYCRLLYTKSEEKALRYAHMLSIDPCNMLSCDGSRFNRATTWTLTRFRRNPLHAVHLERTILEGEPNNPDQLASLLTVAFHSRNTLFVITPPYQGSLICDNPATSMAREIVQGLSGVARLKYEEIG